MEGSRRRKQGASLGQLGEQAALLDAQGPGMDDRQVGEQPMVMIGLHGFRGQGKAEGGLSLLGNDGPEPQRTALLLPGQEGEQQQPKGGQQRVLEHNIGQQQQQQQQRRRQRQIQQDVLLSESALCLWELLHELGHALHMLLSWRPVQAHPAWAGAISNSMNSRSSSSMRSSSSSSSSSSNGNEIRQESRHRSNDYAKQRSPSTQHGAVISTVLPAALADCPSQLPLELLELPSTLLELTAAQVRGQNNGTKALPAALAHCPLQLPLELLELPSTLLELTAARVSKPYPMHSTSTIPFAAAFGAAGPPQVSNLSG
eukprot:1161773-Pelagomonas_calceolata.AAC.25